MFTNIRTSLSLSHLFTATLCGVVLAMGLIMLTPQPAAAQSTSLQSEIQRLMAIIAQMQASHAIGAEVETTQNVFARLTPFGQSQGVQPRGTNGTIVAGPVERGGYTWWQVRYETGVTGWSAERFLRVVSVNSGNDGSQFSVRNGSSFVDAGKADQVIAEVTIEADDELRYLNRVDVEFINEDGRQVVQDAFEKISVWVDGNKVFSVDTSRLNWRTVLDMRMRQEAELFNSQKTGFGIPLPANQAIEVVIAVDVSEEANNDAWMVLIPTRGAALWSASRGNYAAGDNDIHTAEFAVMIEDSKENDLFVRSSAADPDATTFALESDDETDAVVFAFELDGRDSEDDLEINQIVIDADVLKGTTTVPVANVVQSARLLIEGVEYGEFTFTNRGELLLFSDVEFVLGAGSRDTVEVELEFKPAAVAGGHSIELSVEQVLAVTERGTQISAQGSATGDEHRLSGSGVLVEFADSRTTRILNSDATAADDVARFTFELELIAFDTDVFIGQSAVANHLTAGSQTGIGVLYDVLDGSGRVVTTGSTTATVSSRASVQNGRLVLPEGEFEEVFVTIDVSNLPTGFYKVRLTDLNFFTSAQGGAAQNVKLSGRDFESDTVSLEGGTSVVSARVTISAISNASNPVIRGTASGVSVIGVSVKSANGDKVYGSDFISVRNGRWSHRVSETLPSGMYIAEIYVNNVEVTRRAFTVRTVTTQPVIPTPSVVLKANRTVVGDRNDNGVVRLEWDGTNISYCNLVQRLDATNIAWVAEKLRPSGVYNYTAGWKESDYTPITLQLMCVSTYQDGKDRGAEAEITINRERVNEPTPTPVPPTPTPTTPPTTPSVETGTYQGYIDGRLFITSRDVDRTYAVNNCATNAGQNPTKTLRCLWNGEVVATHQATPAVPTTPTAPVAPAEQRAELNVIREGVTVVTETLTKERAEARCATVTRNNPRAVVRCNWDGKRLAHNGQVTVTVNGQLRQNTLRESRAAALSLCDAVVKNNPNGTVVCKLRDEMIKTVRPAVFQNSNVQGAAVSVPALLLELEAVLTAIGDKISQ